jgi:hypothetical protein
MVGSWHLDSDIHLLSSSTEDSWSLHLLVYQVSRSIPILAEQYPSASNLESRGTRWLPIRGLGDRKLRMLRYCLYGRMAARSA